MSDPEGGCGILIIGTVIVVFLLLCLAAAETVVKVISTALGHPLP
jgi:hypothetical protein